MWRSPLIAVVVVLSIFITALLFWGILSYHRQHDLLRTTVVRASHVPHSVRLVHSSHVYG